MGWARAGRSALLHSGAGDRVAGGSAPCWGLLYQGRTDRWHRQCQKEGWAEVQGEEEEQEGKSGWARQGGMGIRTSVCSPVPSSPSALHMLSVFMKFLAQLQTWEPLVLLQSWEQVPKRRHSLTSRQHETGVSREAGRVSPHWGLVCATQGSDTQPLPVPHVCAPRTPFLVPQPFHRPEDTSYWQKPTVSATA